jgi:NAD-dependent DNA ligase
MTSRAKYFKYTAKARLDKSINSLLGIVEGISIDGIINERERHYFHAWIAEHAEVAGLHPFNELIPHIGRAVAGGVLGTEEREDLRWVCAQLNSASYFDQATGDLQRLHAILGGIASDAAISRDELSHLQTWLESHEHLRTCWPYDEVSSMITGVLADGKIDSAESELLRVFFGEFVTVAEHKAIDSSLVRVPAHSGGVCSACPVIQFAGMKFCFTGESSRSPRAELEATVTRLGGSVVSAPSGKVDFLIVGADGNPCWAFACYGRKIEQAMALRKSGARIVLVHENDFYDAVADRS